MQQYNPDERHFAYHLRSYFELLASRTKLEHEVRRFEKVSKNIDKIFEETCIRLPPLQDIEIVEGSVEQLQTLLGEIADNVHKRWDRISLGEHERFNRRYGLMIPETKPLIYIDYRVHFKREYPERYLANLRDIMGITNPLTDSQIENMYWMRRLRVSFDTTNDAITMTKLFLLKFHNKTDNEMKKELLKKRYNLPITSGAH